MKKWLIVLTGLSLALVLVACSPASTTGVSGKISPQDYVTQYVNATKSHILLDVRTPEEFASGYIEGALNIPVQVLAQNLSLLPKDQEIVIYCRSGNRSAQAAEILGQNGYDAVLDMGGIIAWQNAGYTLIQ
jgi:phage shock protein E